MLLNIVVAVESHIGKTDTYLHSCMANYTIFLYSNNVGQNSAYLTLKIFQSHCTNAVLQSNILKIEVEKASCSVIQNSIGRSNA